MSDSWDTPPSNPNNRRSSVYYYTYIINSPIVLYIFLRCDWRVIPPVKSWLSRYISKYRVFEIRIVAGLFVTRMVADDVWRFYNGSQPIRDINFDSCRVPKLGALEACDLCSYKQYFAGRIFRPENYRDYLFSRASDLLLIFILLHHRRCKELVYIVIVSSLLSNTLLFYSIEKIMRRDRGCFTDTLQNKSEIQWVFWIPLDGMKIWKINHVADDKEINKVKWLS